MAIRKVPNGHPKISQVTPAAAIAGGEFQIRGKGFQHIVRPRVRFGEVSAPVVIGSDSLVIARVPDDASLGELVVDNGQHESPAWSCGVGLQMANSMHPVANPAVDFAGAVYTTFSGSRGQKAPVSVYKIDLNHTTQAFLSDIMNATGLVFDREGILYISSRYDGIVYQATPSGAVSVYVEGMGVATGIAFDRDQNLYVGDRSGTIFKISRSRQIYVFATLEPSIAAYHLSFGSEGNLFVTGPTTSSFDSVYRISPAGVVDIYYRGIYYRGLGRPQGMAFDENDNLYVAASLGGRKGVIRIAPDRGAELFLSGPNIVGVAFAPSRSMIVATNSAIFRVDVDIKGMEY
ncbi:MAG: gluconolaconase [Acidobacteria bacterium]|nr:gluconolaconase [Acidobacteriota bacterium]